MRRWAALLVMFGVLSLLTILWFGLRGDPLEPVPSEPVPAVAAATVKLGEALVVAGDCKACHTVRGGTPYAGGRAIPTPFGTFYSPNITPDAETGLGRWTADDFWQALHEGRSREGTLLYPVFPYTNYTRVTRADADAMFAYLRSLPAVPQPPRAHELRFPYNFRLLLIGWRALFFRAGVFEPDTARSAEWNRGAYLVQGLGHCSACHEARNAFGATQARDHPAGGLVLSWYAPALSASTEAGMSRWTTADIVALLKTGIAPRASAFGPMAEVVFESLQHVAEADLRAMAVYLQSLPETTAPAARSFARVSAEARAQSRRRGEKLYAQHCADCHGDAGEGRPPAGPALAGNRALTMGSVVNPVRILLYGGYPPGTAGNPRPFGMPPFSGRLSDEEIADVLSHARTAWGNEARAVAPREVATQRGGPLW